MSYSIGDYVKFCFGNKTYVGKVVKYDSHSEINQWRRHPSEYPIIVEIKFGNIQPRHEYFSFDEEGYATKWERLARVNKLEPV